MKPTPHTPPPFRDELFPCWWVGMHAPAILTPPIPPKSRLRERKASEKRPAPQESKTVLVVVGSAAV